MISFKCINRFYFVKLFLIYFWTEVLTRLVNEGEWREMDVALLGRFSSALILSLVLSFLLYLLGSLSSEGFGHYF